MLNDDFYAAGHHFVRGVCVKERQDGGYCGRRWLDIQYCTSLDVEKPDIAHVGNLNGAEANEIMKMKLAQDNAVSDVLHWFKREKASG